MLNRRSLSLLGISAIVETLGLLWLIPSGFSLHIIVGILSCALIPGAIWLWSEFLYDLREYLKLSKETEDEE